MTSSVNMLMTATSAESRLTTKRNLLSWVKAACMGVIPVLMRAVSFCSLSGISEMSFDSVLVTAK